MRRRCVKSKNARALLLYTSVNFLVAVRNAAGRDSSADRSLVSEREKARRNSRVGRDGVSRGREREIRVVPLAVAKIVIEESEDSRPDCALTASWSYYASAQYEEQA